MATGWFWRHHSPWTILIACCWVEATAGLSYVFSTYSSVLKSELSYDQTKIDQLSVLKDLGDTVGLAAGFLCMVFPRWVILGLGTVLIFFGYGFMWLVVSHGISTPPFWVVCILIFIGTNGCTYLDTAALVIGMESFLTNRGTSVGLLKGFKGLCGAIYNQLYASLLAPDQTSFLLLMALGPVVVVLPLIFILEPSSNRNLIENDSENIMFKCLFGISALLAAYMLLVTLVQDLTFINTYVNILFTVFLFLIIFMPLPIPTVVSYIKQQLQRGKLHVKEPLLDEISRFADSDDMETVAIKPIKVSNESTFDENAARELQLGSNFTILMALKSTNFWLLFLAILFTMGSGTTAMNNLTQIGQAQGYTNTSVFISMVNIWNFVGRVSAGYVSENLTRGFAYPRTVVLAVVQLVMAAGHILLAMAWPGTLYLAVFLIGAGYGAHWAVVPTALSELFGLKNFSVFYNFMTMASPAGSLIYSGYIAGPLYDWEAEKQGTLSTCTGAVCFQVTFFIMAGVCVVGSILSMVISFQTRKLYANTFKQKTAGV